MQSSGTSSLAIPSPNRSPDESPRNRFALVGRSQPLDRRISPARRDLADIRLADRVFAPHYALPVTCCAVAPTPLRAEPDGPAVSELLPGERFEVLELARERAWGVNTADGCVGYVPTAALGGCIEPTHRVAVPQADVRGGEAPDAPLLWRLPMGALVAASGDGAMRAIPGDGLIAAADLVAIDAPAPDFVAVAESLVGTPVHAGGRSGAGVDAAGLVFLALGMAGIAAPRFVDLQAAELGHALDTAAIPARGDLVFFCDHVAILADPETVIHAADAAVARTALAALIASERHGPIVARRRLP